MKRTIVSMAAGCALMLAIPLAATAQGFSVNEHGACAMARGGTGVASACGDGSAINFNPSGIAGTTGGLVGIGVTGILAQGWFTDDLTGSKAGIQNDIIPVPHAYVAYGINEKLTAGFGFFVPYGLGTIWEDTFEGRFNGYDNDLRSMYFQPTLAYQLHPRVKIGAGLDYVMASVKLTQRADLSEFEATPGITFGQLGIPFHTDFANVGLEATGATGIGGNFGITIDPVDGFSIGARYLTRVKLDYDGEVTFDPVATGLILPPQNPIALLNPLLDANLPLPVDVLLEQADLFSDGAALGDQMATTSITMPDQLTVGVAVDVSPSLMLLVDYQWMNWSVFDTLRLDFENAATPDRAIVEGYEDTHGIRVGFDWNGGGPLSVRGGYLYHKGAAPPETVTPLLPEGDRNEFTGGLGFRLTDNLTADLAYQYLKQNNRRGRVREPESGHPPTVDLNTGLYKFNAHLLAATLSVRF